MKRKRVVTREYFVLSIVAERTRSGVLRLTEVTFSKHEKTKKHSKQDCDLFVPVGKREQRKIAQILLRRAEKRLVK